MINTILPALKVLLAASPTILLCLAAEKLNLKPPYRIHQFLMPILAFVFVVITMITYKQISDGLNSLIQKIPEWLGMLRDWMSGFSWMPEFLTGAVNWLSEKMDALLKSLNLNFWIFYITNAAISLAYLIYKKIAISILDAKFKSGGAFMETVAGPFYEFYPEKDIWCLRKNYVDARNLLNVFYCVAASLSFSLMLASRRLYEYELLTAIFCPVFGVILIGEIYFALGGVTRTEYSNRYLGEADDAYRTVNYSLLRKFLRMLFGDKLGSENTTINTAINYNYTNDEVINKLEKDEDPKISTFGIYVRKLNEEGFPLDHNCIRSSVELLKGKSILFNDPFYYDLIPYAFYPMNRALLEHKKVLVVLGRHAVEEDIKRWLQNGVGAVTNIPEMWNIGVLNDTYDDSLDIGIISRSDVLKASLFETNAEFLKRVGFFVIIEPSKLVATAQIGLNLIIKKCRDEKDKNIVFCMCDKNCDGLVDAMSHILMTSITEVSATGKHTGSCSYMTWNADSEYLHHRLFPNVSRYLGLGTELSFAGLKNLVSRTTWYGGEAFPVIDIKWIDRQYYYELMQYAGLPANQEFMDEVFITSSGYWDAETRKYNYLTVEDESCNLFEVVRDFSTRATEQGFVNVITREYLLKEYMVSNYTVFETDSKAIPFISADYARTNRNATLQLLLTMASSGLSEGRLEKEFSLMDIEVFSFKEQLWYEIYQCFANVSSISKYVGMSYRKAVAEIACQRLTLPGIPEIGIDVISVTEQFSMDKGKYENVYRVLDNSFIITYINELKSAGYIAEDEKGDVYYLGSELKNHIFQKYLPGQFFTFGGKYYEMLGLTADDQVLIRRAADHITDRCSYRQLRDYSLLGFRDSYRMGASKSIGGINVVKQFADIAVSTKGYYKMSEYNNFETSKKVVFNESSAIKDRYYNNKELLRIDFPDDQPIDDRVRYTVTLMMNEIFRTVFAENQPYIVAVTDLSFVGDEETCNPLTYSLQSLCEDFCPRSIYILEDSQLDLGLIVAVERNLHRIFDIINDYIEWHLLEIKKSLMPPKKEEPVQQQVIPVTTDESEGEKPKKKKKKNFFKRLLEKIKNFFKRKKTSDPGDDPGDDPGNNPGDDPGNNPGDDPSIDPWVVPGNTDAVPENDFTSIAAADDQYSNSFGDSLITDTMPIDNCFRKKKKPWEEADMIQEEEEPLPELFKKQPYHTSYYLLYGQKGEPSLLDIKGTGKYVSTVFKNRNNTLKQVRDGRKIAKIIEQRYRPNRANARFCDFCGVEILGVEYETLADGRDRCVNCSRTAVRTSEELVKLFDNVKRNMESSFGIKIQAGISVEMVNTRTLQKESGNVFIPSKGFDPRVIGLAVRDKNGFRLLIENGAPRIRSILTIAHELTHIWQYQNWNRKAIRKLYGKDLELEIYEGMAKWAEIQYAYLINEVPIAKREEIITAYRQDEYGRGFLRYRLNYPLTTGTVITGRTPFMNPDRPLGFMYCGEVSIPAEFIRPPETETDEPEEIDYDDLFTEDEPDEPFEPENNDAFEGPHNRDPEKIRYFGYEHLSAADKIIYDQFYQAMLNRIEKVHLDGAGIPLEHGRMIARSVWNDHPELIWVDRTISYYSKPDNVHNEFMFKYPVSQDEAKVRLEEIEAAVPLFLDGVTDEMCDFEAVLRVYNRLIDLVDYDTIGLELEKSQNSADDRPDDLRSVYGILVKHKGVCAGYAVAFTYLMHKIGIECVYVNGKTRAEGSKRFTENHAWNLINLENDYYYVDVTWGDHSDTKPEKNTSQEISYHYFCITTEELLKDHRLDEEFCNYPDCTATACNYYVRTGLYCQSYDFEKIKSIVLKTVRGHRRTIEVKFSDTGELKKAVKELIDGYRIYEILQAINLKLDKTVNSSRYKYSISEEHNTIKFYLQYI